MTPLLFNVILDDLALMIIATGALVGVAGALPGMFLVLRGSAMLTDAISHSILLGIFAAWWLTGNLGGPLQLLGAALAGLAAVALIEIVARSQRVRMDAAIGLVFPAFFALGVLLISLFARDVHLDEDAVLLGEIGFIWLDMVTLAGLELPRALVTIGALALVNAAFVALFYKELKLSVFDRALAGALGFLPGMLFYVLLALTSVTAVAAFDAVGVILFIAFVIVPPATALLLTDRLALAIVLACLLGVAAAISGYLLADIWNLTIGGMMASMTGAFFALALLAGPRHGLVARQLARLRRRRDNDCLSLLAHLRNHEGTAGAAEENTAAALEADLRWGGERRHRVILTALDRGLITRKGETLRLTRRGRAEIDALLPGRMPPRRG
ncbi:metal ABC transporter permease [Alkalilacustris brevis]|uniref:metal ABC transporter permease n=1 Tax=Alkalilacustris brevis TaxID=2026338 RepID=UPI000E0DA028|nr:metal ABC transporter permease [Alkalilacustris brevis]